MSHNAGPQIAFHSNDRSTQNAQGLMHVLTTTTTYVFNG